VPYARGRFWKGGTFFDLADARQQAERWSREVAGQRVHGTNRNCRWCSSRTRKRAHLLPYDGIPCEVPLWRQVTVHPDHHVSLQYALYSAPSTNCPPDTRLEARCDRALVKLYRRGELVKVQPRQPKGGRATDPDDYPPERTAYAMQSSDGLVRQAATVGPSVGQFAERLLDASSRGPSYARGRSCCAAKRCTPERVDAARIRALGFDLVDVRRLERILVLALDTNASSRQRRPTGFGPCRLGVTRDLATPRRAPSTAVYLAQRPERRPEPPRTAPAVPRPRSGRPCRPRGSRSGWGRTARPSCAGPERSRHGTW
jgi:hypothetical protein